MKPEADSVAREMIGRAARGGEPSAFFALAAGYARGAYARTRAGGLDHAGACERVVALFAKMYRMYYASVPAMPFDEWYKRRGQNIDGVLDNGRDDGNPSALPDDERLAEFDARMQLMLQREHSRLAYENGRQRPRRRPLARRPAVLIAAAVIAVAIGALGMPAVLSCAGASFLMVARLRSRAIALRIPGTGRGLSRTVDVWRFARTPAGSVPVRDSAAVAPDSTPAVSSSTSEAALTAPAAAAVPSPPPPARRPAARPVAAPRRAVVRPAASPQPSASAGAASTAAGDSAAAPSTTPDSMQTLAP